MPPRTPLTSPPDHQSHAVLPGLIHEGSAIAEGGFRFTTMFDSTRRPGSSAIISTRHGEVTGTCRITETIEAFVSASIGHGTRGAVAVSSTRGARRAASVFCRPAE